MPCLSTRETRPAFNHVYIKLAYPFGTAVISLAGVVRKPTKLQPCFSGFQEIISVFLDVELFHFYEKESVDFVIVC